jgi:hypothetical protein
LGDAIGTPLEEAEAVEEEAVELVDIVIIDEDELACRCNPSQSHKLRTHGNGRVHIPQELQPNMKSRRERRWLSQRLDVD